MKEVISCPLQPPQRRASALQVDCGVPTFAGPALNFEIKALAPLVFSSFPQLHPCRKEEQDTPGSLRGTPSAPVWDPTPARQLPRAPRRTRAHSSPHLEEGGARPRRDVTAPGTSCGSQGGARGPRGRGRKKSHTILARFRPSRVPALGAPARALHPGLEQGALGVCGSGCGAGQPVPPRRAEATGNRGGGRRVRTRGRRSLPPAGTAAETGREERRSALAGGWRLLPAAPEPVHRRGRARGRALPARVAAWVSIVALTGHGARTRVGAGRVGRSPLAVLCWAAGLEPLTGRPAPSGSLRLPWGEDDRERDKVALAALLLRGGAHIGFLRKKERKKKALTPPRPLCPHRHFVVESWKRRK